MYISDFRWVKVVEKLVGEMQRIAFCLLLSVCVCVCMSHLWMPGKRLEIKTSFFF